MKKSILLFLPFMLIGCASSNNPSSVISSVSSSIESISSEEESTLADVIILAGQSNCEGNSYVSYLRSNTTQEQKDNYKNGFEDTLIKFSCYRGLNKSSSFIPVRQGMGYSVDKFGIELGMAEAFKEASLSHKTYIIKYAVGGTSLFQNWHSPSSSLGTSELYDNLIDFTHTALEELESENIIPVVKAICWMQGETDASSNSSSLYYDLEKNFVKDLNKELSYYAPQEGIKFIDGGISDCSAWTNYQVINNAKKKLAEENPSSHFYIDTIKEGLEYNKEPEGNVDIYHYDALSELKLGKLFSKVILDNNLLQK